VAIHMGPEFLGTMTEKTRQAGRLHKRATTLQSSLY
jgi:hypothetical protein